jgi:hypothetical protein
MGYFLPLRGFLVVGRGVLELLTTEYKYNTSIPNTQATIITGIASSEYRCAR